MEAHASASVAGPSNSKPRLRSHSQQNSASHSSPPFPLSKRESSKNALRDTYDAGTKVNATTNSGRRRRSASTTSPPTIPPARTRRGSNSRGKQPVGTREREGALTAIGRDRGGGDEQLRHSHGLSWSSTTRDSVVDNLLFSLDNVLRGDVNELGWEPDAELERLKSMFSAAPPMPANRTAQRARGHTYSSSLSSDYDRTTVPNTPSTVASKGRRSNSSSNFPLRPSISGKMFSAGKPNGIGRASTDTQQTARKTNGSHARNESELSDDSFTLGMGAPKSGRRSMSMDQLYTEPGRNGPSMLDRGRPVPSVHSKFEGPMDGAPEPGVPSGPRNMQNPGGAGPVYVNQAPPKNSNVRKVTTQADLRSASMPMPSPAISLEVRNRASDFVRASSMRGDSIAPSIEPPGNQPSPGLQQPNIHGGNSSSRERPGFFKRVFGSSSSRTSSGHYDNGDLAAVPGNRVTVSAGPSRPRMQATSSSKEQQPKEKAYPPVSLNKKPSSFFRRRKKSADENAPPPPPLVNANLINAQRAPNAQASPSISSLRKVMDPFLADAQPPKPQSRSRSRPDTTESSNVEDSDLDIFHSGYTPPTGASLGNRDPLSRRTSTGHKTSVEQTESPQSKMKVRKRKPENLQNQSYFDNQDSIPQSDALRVDTSEAPIVSPLAERKSHDQEYQRPASRASTGDDIIAMSNPASVQEEAARNDSNATHESAEENSLRLSTSDRLHPKENSGLFLRPTDSEELLGRKYEELSPVVEQGSREVSVAGSNKSPALGTATSGTFHSAMASPASPTSTKFHSTTSLPLPSLQIDGNDPRKSVEANGLLIGTSLPSAPVDERAEYHERARRIYEGDEEDVWKGEAASWLGETNILSKRTLEAYMQLFDFAGQNVLVTLRTLCGKLILKGETQQFDRIITALSSRWCECNARHGFKAQDVVHTIFYSVILLNTDLHLADIGEKMSRSAYVKNTLPTIKRVVQDAAPNAFDETVRPNPNASRPTLPWTNSTGSIPPASPTLQTPTGEKASHEGDRPVLSKRLSLRPDFSRQNSDSWSPDVAAMSNANLLVSQPFTGPMRAWENEIETILKSFFASIRSEPLPLHGAPPVETLLKERNLSVANQNGLKRSGSIVSKAPSDNASFRSKPGFRTLTGFQSKYNRSRPKIYPTSTHGSSKTSFDDGSVWSPVQSSTWSKYSMSKTLTSASMQSLNQFSPTTGDFKHSIGFANALSQAIIREESGNGGGDTESVSMSVPGGLLEDEALSLEGAPWAKEGMVKHKHHLDGPGKKAKERSWNDCFAVMGKGKLTLFAFNTTSKTQSIGRKGLSKATANGRASSVAGARVGGGDWMENAEQLDVFILRQTIASTLPPPGYSKLRPYVWALSLPSGAVHLFQVGTPEIAGEFMSTANYWSARLSKEPLSGSVSNIEYGWSDTAINPALIDSSARPGSSSPPPAPPSSHRHIHSNSIGSGMPRPSFQSSMRGSFDQGFGGRMRLQGDKVQIADWAPPSQSMMASALMEVDQLRGLKAYVANVEGELARHNELKGAIELAYSPRHANFTKAMANWQRKSDYLLREIVKFQTYSDSLDAAQTAKEAFYQRQKRRDELVGAGTEVPGASASA